MQFKLVFSVLQFYGKLDILEDRWVCFKEINKSYLDWIKIYVVSHNLHTGFKSLLVLSLKTQSFDFIL